MKKILFVLIAGFLAISSIGLVVTQVRADEDFKTINETITISKPEIASENDFATIALKESNSYFSQAGKPELPTITRVFTLPFGSKISSVEVIYNGQNQISISKSVKPAEEPIPIGTEIQANTQVYDSSVSYPSSQFSYRAGSGLSGNEHVLFLTVQCYPIFYAPSENILSYCDSIDITASYTEGKGLSAASEDYDMVVISTNTFSSSIQSLIDHKNSHGITTYFKDVEEIYAQYSGRDEPEKIKYFIKDAIETQGVSYVLLVGNIDELPIRTAAVSWWHGESLDIPTDLYYADVYDQNGDFCTWDANGNNIFGEFDLDNGNIDDADLYPDAYVGRIPCQGTRDLNIVINKIIKYENTAYGQSWYKKMLLMGGDTFPGEGLLEGEYVTGLVGEQMTEFEQTFLWTSKGNFRPMIINFRASQGAGFISYSGHGYITGFGTYKPDGVKRISYYNPYLFGMLNGDKLPIVFFDACDTGILDNRPYSDKIVPAFAYNMIRKATGGAIGAIGATRVAFTHVNEQGVQGGASYLNLRFFTDYEEGLTFSQIFTAAQNDYINYVGEDCITIDEFIIIGDPSLMPGGYPS